MRELLEQFDSIAQNPKEQYEALLSQGKKVVGCMTYFCPEELVLSVGMVPFGMWGGDIEANEAKSWFPAFICSILQTTLELGIKGAYSGMTAVIIPKLCDSLKCMQPNWELAVPDIPVISLPHAQNSKLDAGIDFTASQYRKILGELTAFGGKSPSNEDIFDALKLINRRRQALRMFIALAAKHPDVVSAHSRSNVMKSSYFMEAQPYTAMLEKLNSALAQLPPSDWQGIRVITSGILADAPALLEILDENNISIVADQILHESVSFRHDADETGDPFQSLARLLATVEGTSVFHDPGKKRAYELLSLAKETSADGVLFVLTKFCDPEEYDYVPLKNLLEQSGVPCLAVELDRQTPGLAQARTAIEAFAQVLKSTKE